MNASKYRLRIFVSLLFLFFAPATLADTALVNKFDWLPFSQLSKPDADLIEKIQRSSFGYFWDFAHPNSGLARERSKSGDLVTTGGTGFGILSIVVATERKWVSRQEALKRLHKIADFLEKADRFHGVWPHWLNGNSGKAIPFSPKDDGADLVETAFLVQGLLTAREYFRRDTKSEKLLRQTITRLWEGVEWSWFTNGGDCLLWHWSPKFGFEKNHRISGWNEGLIVYVLAASSPTYSIKPTVYHNGWARKGKMVNRTPFRGMKIPLGSASGGPLFFSHYSFLCLDPRGLKDRYADYWAQNVTHSLVNYSYCVNDAKAEYKYSKKCWGLTASDDPWGYLAHQPGKRDNGTISPTAALSSIAYTPRPSMDAARYFYKELGDRLWGKYGFYDAFNLKENWFSKQYLAIDQGPIVVMIENYRSALIWKIFMRSSEVKAGLQRLGFTRKSQ